MADAHCDDLSTAVKSRFDRLSTELDGLIFRNVAGYHEKYFPNTTNILAQPSLSSAEFSSDLRTLLMEISSSKTESFLNTFALRNTDEVILTAKNHLPLVDTSSDGAILVFGMCQTASDASSDSAIFSFCERVISVFAARPSRYFLHAFRLYGSSIETWTFDRAGAYSGRAVDMKREPKLFHKIVAGYLSMGNGSSGANPVFNTEGRQQFVKLEGDNPTERLAISADALVKQENFTGSGTSCFKALSPNSSKELIVKFAWTPQTYPGEYRFLEIVKDKNIWGVVKLEGHQYLCDIEELRRGLRFDQPRLSSTLVSDHTQSVDDTILSEPTPTNPAIALQFDDTTQHNMDPLFENLKFECTVTSPLGRPLDTFSTPSELFLILKDITKALRSLYLEANIIHRDVSTQNIIIAPKDEQDDGTPWGMLIDLNLALDLSHPPEKEDLVGSEGFMAIGILGGDNATYRHDLESVFYVFIWIAICHDGIATSRHIPDQSRLHAWCGTDWLASFHSKRNDMLPANFARWIQEEFSARFRPYLPLAERLHETLFPIKNDRIFIGTDFEPEATKQLYEDMIVAFSTAARS